jgi:hypothetical protein
MAALAGSGDRLAKEAAELSANVQRFKEESAQEVMEVLILFCISFSTDTQNVVRRTHR